MNGTCQTCANWIRDEFDHGQCQIAYSGGSTMSTVTGMVKAVAANDDSEAILVTHKDFGCNQHEPR